MSPLIPVSDTTTLLVALRHVLPGLDGRVGPPAAGSLCAGPAGEAAVGELVAHWRLAHPEAGPPYWGSRSWTMLVWQPVYLAVLSLHLSGCLPRLAGMAQARRDGLVSGFSLPPAGLVRVDEAEGLACAGVALRTLCWSLFDTLAAATPLHPKMAGRLLADCTLSALLQAQRCDARLDNARLQALTPRWLQALDLPAASGLVAVRLDDGRERLALQRKVCCQHFRRHDGELCSTCPKRKPAARLALLKQELSHDVFTA